MACDPQVSIDALSVVSPPKRRFQAARIRLKTARRLAAALVRIDGYVALGVVPCRASSSCFTVRRDGLWPRWTARVTET